MLSTLTAEQKNMVQRMQTVLGFAADLAHARVTIYLPTADNKYFNIFAEEHPVTQKMNEKINLTGQKVRCVEEPIVLNAYKQGISVEALREWALGEFVHLKVYPLRDFTGKTFGVVSFETRAFNEVFISQCYEFLTNLENPSSEMHKRMNAADGLVVVDRGRKVIAANNQAMGIFSNMDIENIVGRHTNHMPVNWPLVSMVLDTGLGESKETRLHGILLSIRAFPVIPRPKAGCAFVILRDITELRQKDEELNIKSVVIKEIHHRVKNNLQTITSLLRMQERRAKSEETKTVLRDCIGRVGSIAIVHEYLSHHEEGMLEVSHVAKEIYKELMSSMIRPDFKLEASFKAEEIFLPSDRATSIALIINELLQNVIEHAFEDREKGKLFVEFRKLENEFVIEIADDGNGLPEGFNIKKSRSLGLKIIKTMTESDLAGKFTISNRAEGGTLARVSIPRGV
ncbi:MAG: histidine kinase N-terminal domain-containing protein [Phascolarctobacterium sp.]|nr:histidine kinase N-terminal domain-containing protein [Phascolarctobacterium sp.]